MASQLTANNAPSSLLPKEHVSTLQSKLQLLFKGDTGNPKTSVALGEGPLWDPDLRVLYWLDNVAGTIYRFDPATGLQRSVDVDQPLGSFALTERQDQVLLTGERGISLFDWATLREYPLHPLPRPDPATVPAMPADVSPGFSRGLRFNEGAVDAAGRFLAGTYEMDEPNGEAQAELYSFEATSDPDPTKPQLVLRRTLLRRLWISNGIGWNHDSSVLYFIDSMSLAVVAYKYDLASGALLDDGTTIIRFPREWGVPDGLSVDAEGMLWVASFGGYRVSRWDPHTGRQLDEIRTPTGQIPSLTFMGADLRDLVVVSGARGEGLLSREPLAGSVFSVKAMAVAGKPAPRLRGRIALDESKATQRQSRQETRIAVTDLPAA